MTAERHSPTEAPPAGFDISVVICTRCRADSLRELLTCLSRDDRAGIDVEIVVVDNAGSDNSREVAASFASAFPVRYLMEPRVGKCHALNRALDTGGLGTIIAFIDDDLTPEPGWLKGVQAVCERWPYHDLFGGRSYVVFPPGEPIPPWAHNKRLHGWAFSVVDHGTRDAEIPLGQFPVGNHFWVRSRALVRGRRFPALWLTEPGLLLGLQDDGYSGVSAGDVAAGHRIQPHLFQKDVILQRMAQLGRDMPYVRMPNVHVFGRARMFRDYPLLLVVICAANTLRWLLLYGFTFLLRDPDVKFAKQVVAVNALLNNWESVWHWRRIRQFCRLQWRDLAAARQAYDEEQSNPGR